jgi:uncharacterized iron-regulated protein
VTRRLVASVLALAAAGCASVPASRSLTGRIWDTAAGRFADRPALEARLVAARFVLLGEKHDNAEHHRLQAALLAALVAAGRRPAVAFEMLTADQASALARHLAQAPRDAAGLGAAVGWESSGWPPWTMYEPIARVALDAGLPIVAADLGRDAKQAVRQGGLAALDRTLVMRTGLDRPLATVVRAAMAEELRRAHCGHAPERALEAMIAAQRARDGEMAVRMVTAGAVDGAVLIAGAGHVRKDWGVPAYLAVASPGSTIATVAFAEVREGSDPRAAAAAVGGARAYDYVWFTAPADDVDPCEKFRRSLERLERRR